jgi:hypothetical protein
MKRLICLFGLLAYPDAGFSEPNATIGGTGSDLGVFRLNQDVLDHKPDLMFIEFAVNDGGAALERIQRRMEGNRRTLFDMDISGGQPSVVIKALAGSFPGKVRLLPALPAGTRPDPTPIRMSDRPSLSRTPFSV